MKVVIADDEHLVRFSLKSMIEELNLDLRVVAEAANGDELVAQVARHQPDVCFVDIRMPGLGGLAAIRKARKAGSQARWIILTSHAEFDYATEALSLGVSSYLLKPIGPASLAEVLGPLVKAVDRDLKDESVRFEHSLVAALGAPEARVTEPPLLSACWLISLRCDCAAACSSRERADFPARVLERVREAAASVLTRGLLTAAWVGGGDLVQVAANWEEGNLDARNAAARLRESLGILVRQDAGGLQRVTGFWADGMSSWEDFRKVVDDLARLSCQRILLGTGLIHPVALAQRRLDSLPEAVTGLARPIEQFLELRERGEIPALEARARALRDAFASVGSSVAVLETAARFIAFRTGLEPPAAPFTGAGLAQWAEGLVSATRSELPELRRSADFQVRIVERVDEYLLANLRTEVRVPDIASSLGLSPNYLSSVYHKLTQSTISERLAVLRLDLARELLSRPGSQVKEVSAAVGYKSPRYFAQLYHKRFGHHPSGR